MSVFKVKSVAVKVDSLKSSIRDSKHDLVYETFKPLATALIKKQVQKVLFLFLNGMHLCKHTSELDQGSGRHMVSNLTGVKITNTDNAEYSNATDFVQCDANAVRRK